MEELETGRNPNSASPRGPVSHPERGGARLYGPAQQGHAGLWSWRGIAGRVGRRGIVNLMKNH
jgi:hypothetical protein